MNVTVIVLAAGRGERFRAAGGDTHKLDAPLLGKSMLQHVLDAVAASSLPFHLVRPEGGGAGMGDSIALGVRATRDADGWLILPGDLPLVRASSLQRVAHALREHAVVVPNHRGQRGHPVGFDKQCFDALARLSGDNGAARIVRGMRQQGRVLDLALDDPGITFDVDTPEDLREAQRRLQAHTAAS